MPAPPSETTDHPHEAAESGAPRPRHLSMLRALKLADLFTIANAVCGTSAIFLCLNYLDARDGASDVFLWAAFALLPLAVVFDVLDGRVARSRAASPYGADLDSLADIISFGVAPATLGFTLGLRGGWDSVILIYFVVCGIARLARYNVTAASLSDASGKVRYYEGTPIPTSLLIVAILAVAAGMGDIHAHFWLGEFQLGPWRLHPFSLLYLASGTAMVSATLRIPKP